MIKANVVNHEILTRIDQFVKGQHVIFYDLVSKKSILTTMIEGMLI